MFMGFALSNVFYKVIIMNIVGIDLGTTNSLISYFKDGKSQIIKNVHNERLTPSVVSVLENGEIIIGQAAKERLYTHPHLTAAAFKRFMGTKKKYTLGKYTFTPVELSSLVLKSLKADAEVALGECIEEAVISVPAYFNEQQRRATKQAGELAGLRVERLISEPTAVALAYGLHENNGDCQFLVFDLGGGTFDVSVVELFDNILEVKAVAGDNFLGGEDFDQAITDYFIQNQQLQNYLDAKGQSIIKEKAEAVKCKLSSCKTAEMNVVLGDMLYTTTLTRTILKEIFEPIFLRLRQPIMRALHDAKLTTTDLSHVILAGGSSRMPSIRTYVTRMFERLPMDSIDPDEAIVLGAGVAAALKERNQDLSERRMTDVCPYTLGTDIVEDNQFGSLQTNIYQPIIERNTVIPCSRVVRLYNAVDNQRKMNIKIYQGENRQADQNLKLGELNINIPPKPKWQSAVDIRYTYDVNGLLEVEVTSLDTGQTKRQIIVNSENQLTPEEINACFKRLASLKIHPREKDENRLLLARAGRLYEEFLGEMRTIIDRQTILFEAVLDKQDLFLIEEAAKEFSAFLDEIEGVMY